MSKTMLLGLWFLSGATWADVGSLRDRLLSTDPAVAEPAAKEAEGLSGRERKLLITTLAIALHPNAESARAAASALAHFQKDAESAVPDLMTALRYDEPDVALAVGNALVQIGPASVRPLTKALDDANFILRKRAAAILGAMGSTARAAAPELAALLNDTQPEVQSTAEAALLKMGEPAVPALEHAVKHFSNPEARQNVVRLLGRFGAPASAVLVQTVRKDASSGVRVTAAGALAAIRPPAAPVVPALTDCLKDPDDHVRMAAVEALGQLGPEAKAAIGPLIVTSHRDSEALARQRSLEALKSIGPASKASLSGLVDNLKATDGDIRRESVAALESADVAPADAVSVLALAIRDHDPSVRLAAVQVAVPWVKTHSEMLQILRIAALDSDKKVRPAAIAALGEAAASPEGAARALEEVLRDADPAVRSAGIDALAKLGGPAVSILVRATSDSYSVLGEKAEQAIVAMGPDALPFLEKVQSGPDPVLQKKAASVIAQIQSGGQPLRRTTKPHKKS